MAKLNKNALKWLRALESGKYKRGKNSLRDGDKFCCLGVACNEYAKEKKIEWKNECFMGEGQYLPKKVRDWLGLKNERGELSADQSFSKAEYNRDRICTLDDLNDNGYSFKKIAQKIRKFKDDLFV